MTDPLPYESAVATGRGDDGTTGLLFGGERIAKDDPRAEAYGTIDEAVAALGPRPRRAGRQGQYGVLGAIARRSGRPDPPPPARAVRGRRRAGDEPRPLATRRATARRASTSRWSRASTRCCARPRRTSTLPREFVVPGETRVQRRARARPDARPPRRAPGRDAARATGCLPSGQVLPYLNRLADLLWILARAAEQAEARPATMARTIDRTARERAQTQ